MPLRARHVLGLGHRCLCPGRGAQFHAGCAMSRTLSVPQWQAEPAGPHTPLHSGPHWGEQGCSVSEMLLLEGMAGCWMGRSESHMGQAGLHQLENLSDSHWSPFISFPMCNCKGCISEAWLSLVSCIISLIW